MRIAWGAEAAAIAVAVLLLALFKHPEYIAAVICLIVGLHLLPLASLFQVRVYALVGIALSLLGAGTLLAMLFGLLLGGLWTWPVVVGLGSAHPNLKTVETSPRPAGSSKLLMNQIDEFIFWQSER